MLFFDAQFLVPVQPLIDPLFKILLLGAGFDEVFDFHLFKFTVAENEVAGGNFITERFTHLGDAEGQFLAGGGNDVLKIDEHALGGFRPQVDGGIGVFDRAHKGLKHQVELARIGKLAAAGRAGLLFQFVRPPALLAAFAFHQRVGEILEVSAGYPDLGMHQDTGIDTDHIIPALDHIFPPGVFDIAFQLDAQRSEVPATGQTAVDFAALKDKPPPAAEGNNFLHCRFSRNFFSHESPPVK